MNTWIMASKYSKELIAAENDQTKDSRAFFDEIFPELAMKAVEELKISFDHIIIDEAQDILSYKNLLLLDKLIAGGLSKGSWTFFGDFEQQSIYESARSLDEVRSDIMKISGNVYAVGRLKINCRNSAKIATETAKVSGFEKAPTKNLNLEGADVIFQFYKANTEQAKQVSAEIIRLKNAGLVPSDIVILSNKRLSASGANGADSTGAFQIVEVNQTKWPILSDSQVAFCTIKSFKGLEAKAVIICDLEKIDDKEAKSLIYVGMSRAKSHLTVFSGSSIRDQIVEARNKTLS
jgi:superfamily I DNA/RNA helicase